MFPNAGVRAEPKSLRPPSTLANIGSFLGSVSSYVAQNLPEKLGGTNTTLDGVDANGSEPDPYERILAARFAWVDWGCSKVDGHRATSGTRGCDCGRRSRLHLLLGYQNGFQVWNLSDTDDIREAASVRRNVAKVSFIEAVPNPRIPSDRSYCDSFESSRPLITYITETPALEGRKESNLVEFWSLRQSKVVQSLDFAQDSVWGVKCTERFIGVALRSGGLRVYASHNLQLVLTLTDLLPSPTDDRSFTIVDVGSRYISYATSSPLPMKRRKSQIGDNANRSEGDTDEDEHARVNARKVAGKVAKELVVGAKVLGGFAYNALSSYVAPQNQPSSPQDSSDQKERQSVTSNSSNGIPSGRPDKRVDVPDGLVIVRDLPPSLLELSTPTHSATVISHWQAHTNPISNISFNPNETLLVTATIQGSTFHVWQLPGRSSGPTPRTPRWLYKLERGITAASVEDITFSFDSRWIGVSTAHGTTHLYRINPTGSKKGNSGTERLNVINGLADAKGRGGALLDDDVPEESGGKGATSTWPVVRIKQQNTLERPSSVAGDGESRWGYGSMRRASQAFAGDGRVLGLGASQGKGAPPAQPRSALLAVFLRKKITTSEKTASPARSKAPDRRSYTRGVGSISPAALSPSPTGSTSSGDFVSKVLRQQALTFHPDGTLKLHNVDVTVESRPAVVHAPPSQRRTSISSSPLESLSPSFLSHAFRMSKNSGPNVKISTSEVIEWSLMRETEWPEVNTAIQICRTPTVPRSPTTSTSTAASIWPSKIEIVTYDAAAFGQPIWMGPQFEFRTYVHHSSTGGSDGDGEREPFRRPSPRTIRAGPWEDRTHYQSGALPYSEADLSDLPEAVRINIKRETVKPYGEESIPSRDIYPDIVDRNHHDVEEGLSTAMESMMERKTSSSPPIPIRDATRIGYVPDDLSFDDAAEISLTVSYKDRPPGPMDHFTTAPLRRTMSGLSEGRVSSIGSGSSWPVSSPASAGRLEENLIGLFDEELGLEEEKIVDGEGEKSVSSPGDELVPGDDESMDSVILGRDGEELPL
ncbi:hypothetical protein HK097_007495 [Rhizophlyctis rosea]|uniref:BCAS3 WD40 domain-containing protein n=1 Tax=Rhizophlyctis rosea TaxID=64517 RepID=A0AAD5SIP3_9FUNG|nr:hypothetical protein HK097_007495 [Rhizophlyctis rosea]